MLCEDLKLYVFRRNFDILNKINFEFNSTIGLEFMDQNDCLLGIGVDRKFFVLVKLMIHWAVTSFDYFSEQRRFSHCFQKSIPQSQRVIFFFLI